MDTGIIVGAVVAVGLSMVFWYGTWRYMRRKFVRYTQEMEEMIRRIQKGEYLNKEMLYNETLSSKTKQELLRLSDICRNERESSLRQKQEIQQMVSDISHQLKTPIANIVMYQDMLLSRKSSNQKRPGEEENWLRIMQSQVKKLDFLVQALLKMSRLESSMITLKLQEENLYQCIAEAVAQVTRKAKEKSLDIQVECPEETYLPLDMKWMAEAIGNVLDNAVKYSPNSGKITITVSKLELFVRVDICDEGPGIEEKHYADIFKRFWRAPGMHKEEGVGIGLYLTREILTRQGGYCRVNTAESGGSCFSLYLPG
ncbi:MAG: HAMP domain-containing histidine kinase [Ruminococcus sp.]|nr:HAMP domain-containing histidine kinase [Ruminococcus sp.]